MPIYEYKCDSCGHGFSLLVSSSAKALEAKCPTCGSQSVTKQMSAFACSPSGGGGFVGSGGGGG